MAACGSDDGEQTAVQVAPATLSLTIDTPSSDGALVAGQFVVAGRLVISGQPVRGVIIDVDGSAVTTDDGGRYELVVLAESGPRTIRVQYDADGDTVAASRSIVVDALAPRLSLTSDGVELDGPAKVVVLPTDGALDVNVTVSDENGTGAWTVNPAELRVDDTVSGVVDGLRIVVVSVADALGNLAEEHLTVLQADLVDPATPIDDAVVVHLGANALNAGAQLTANILGDLDLTSYATSLNPVLDTESARVSVSAVSIGPDPVVTLVSGTDRIDLGLSVDALDISAQATVSLGEEPTVFDVRVQVDTIEISAGLQVVPDGGFFKLTVDPPVFNFVEPKVFVVTDQGSAPAGAALEGQVVDAVEALLSDLVQSQATAVVDTALAALSDPFTVEVVGVEVTVDLSAVSTGLTDGGIDLRLSGSVSLGGTPVAENTLGVRRTDGGALSPTDDDVVVALSDDLVNTLLHGLWRFGGLDFTVDQALLDESNSGVTLVAGFLGGLLDVVGGLDPETPMTVDIKTRVPPMLVNAPDSDAVALAAGGIDVSFRTAEATLANGFLGVELAADAVSDLDGVVLGLDPYTIAFDLFTGEPESKRQLESGVEPFVTSLVREIGPVLGDILGTLPIPSFGGLTPTDLSVSDGGSGGQFIVLRGKVRID